MAFSVRRVVTGHDENGKAVVKIDELMSEPRSTRPGDRVRYVVSGDEVRILPVRPLARLFGALKHDGPPRTLEDMERAIAEGAGEA